MGPFLEESNSTMTFSMQAYFFLMQIHIEQDMKNEVVTCKTQFMSPFFILFY